MMMGTTASTAVSNPTQTHQTLTETNLLLHLFIDQWRKKKVCLCDFGHNFVSQAQPKQ